MSFALIINQILTLFIIILIGYILRKKEHINEKINQGLSNLLINIILPALIISSMSLKINQNLINNIKIMVLISIITYIFVILFTNLIVKVLSLSGQKKTVFKFLIIFGNVGYMGYPVINAIYPQYGIFYSVFNNVVFGCLMWTYGIYLFIGDEDGNKIQWKKIFNNGLIATLFGIILLLTGYNLPTPVAGALKYLGNMTFPLSMLIIGSSLADVKLKELIGNKLIFLVISLKLLIIPLIIFMILKQFNLPTITTNISIILFAMPSGANAVIFAEKFDGDYKFAAETVFLTTLLSLITIPIFISLI